MSSAKIAVLELLDSGMSAIKVLNRSGEGISPCCLTDVLMDLFVENSLFKLTEDDLSEESSLLFLTDK